MHRKYNLIARKMIRQLEVVGRGSGRVLAGSQWTQVALRDTALGAGRSGTFPGRLATLKVKASRDMPLVSLKDDSALTRSVRRIFHEAGFVSKAAAQCGQWDWLVAMASPEVSWQVARIWNGRYLSHAAGAWRKVCQDGLETRLEHTVSRHRPKRDS